MAKFFSSGILFSLRWLEISHVLLAIVVVLDVLVVVVVIEVVATVTVLTLVVLFNDVLSGAGGVVGDAETIFLVSGELTKELLTS
jgi:hypothetical protein